MKGLILIVDDETAFLRLTAQWLSQQGYQVLTAESRDQAQQLYHTRQPDIVLLDLVMPPDRQLATGLAAIEDFSDSPVIVLTAHADHQTALTAMSRGAWDFLAKPVDPDLLKIVVDRAVEKHHLWQEIKALRAQKQQLKGLIGTSPVMQHLSQMITRLAPTDLSIVIQGPSGTGKELVAQALHQLSPQSDRAFVTLHCGAVPENLMESELFGHLKGSFTGAHQDRKGMVAMADDGTLFLDEIGEISLALQVKLLRFLQDGSYTPIGGRQPQKAKVRVISATHRDLEKMVAEGQMREDFYYRLKGMVLRTPPLADRQEDIILLAQAFLTQAAQLRGQKASLTRAALLWLQQAAWPGQVRELKAVMTAAAALMNPTGTGQVDVPDLIFARDGSLPADPDQNSNSGVADQTLAGAVAHLEKQMITSTLGSCQDNRSAAARILGLSRVGLLKKMARLGLR